VSLDVGNTIVTAAEPGLGTLLTRVAEPGPLLDEAITLLHTRATTQALVDEICGMLSIQPVDLARYRPPDPIVMPDVVEGLARLRALNVRLVSLSNVASIDAVALPTIINDSLDAHYQSFRVGAAKPDEAAFRAMLQSEGVDPHHCLHIGDSWRCDALGALSAGMSTIWLQPPPGTHAAPCHDGLFVVGSFSEAVETLVVGMTHD
jgi:FMN phosphatase YigB (HAD superfamily)